MVTLRIQEIALSKGFTISEMQRRTLMSFPALRRYWYNQNGQVSLEALETFARVLDVKFCDLFKTDEQ